MNLEEIKTTYPELLRKYLFEGKEEEALYEAYKLGKECFESKIGIEDIMNLHTRSLEEIIKTLPPSRVHDIVLKSSNLIIEFSIRFGLACQNYFEILQKTDERIRNAFYQAGEALTAGLDIQKMLYVVLNLVKNLTEAIGCSIVVFKEGRTIINVSEGLEAQDKFFKHPLFEQVRNEGKAKFISDMQEAKVLKDGREIRSVLALPLNFKSKTIGVLGIYLASPHHYEEKEINLLTSFACQAAVAIDNARLFSELSRHDKTLEALYSIDRVVSQTLDIEEILQSALARAMECIDADSGSIHLLDRTGENLILEIHSGLLSQEFISSISKLKMGEGITGRAAKMQKPEAVDISHYPDVWLLPHLEKEGIFSLASTPLVAKGKVLGAMTFTNHEYRLFSQDDLDLLFSIGNAIGIAVENARLYKEVRDKAEHISALYRITRAIKASLDIEEVFDVMVSEMRSILPFDRTSINLVREETVEVFALAGEIIIQELRRGTKIPRSKSGSGFVLDRRAGLIRNLKDTTPFYEDKILFKKGINSVIQVPLISKGEMIGVFSIESCMQEAYTQQELNLAQAIADQIATSIENLRLYEDLKKANLELEKRIKEFEEFHTLAVGRELRMMELKERIQSLEEGK
jgi:GAF domain-containing protein